MEMMQFKNELKVHTFVQDMKQDDELKHVAEKVETMTLKPVLEGMVSVADGPHEFNGAISMNPLHFVDNGPRFVPVPAKPFMFDIASNHIDFAYDIVERRMKNVTSRDGLNEEYYLARLNQPDDENDMDVDAAAHDQHGGSKGIMGFVSGLWGR